MLEHLVQSSIRMRGATLVLFVCLLLAGIVAALKLPVDAMPDVSTVQVSVLTRTGGLSAVEAENSVSVPIERALNGTPGMVELRSMATTGVASVTAVFDDATDPWFARQLVLERLRGIERELPPGAQTPELAPLSTGLGEIFTFVVRSPVHTPMQLRTLLDWEIVPKLREVPGVTEVNTMGGDLKQYQIHVDPERMRAQGVHLSDILLAVREANQNTGGGYLDRGAESFVIRGEGRLKDASEIENIVLSHVPGHAAVLVKHVARVEIGAALKYGVTTSNGESEAVAGIVMMLLGANSHDVVKAVSARVDAMRQQLPEGVEIDVLYDRSDFVGRTLTTVLTNLLEGVAIVTLVLFLFLGTLRGALAVVLGIPAAMSVALLGMHLFGVTGDLMSLGAIDFGFLVDGPIVMLEAVIAVTAGRKLNHRARSVEYCDVLKRSVRPVGFAVAIIMLVYLPLLALEGVEGKMFRPMAMTMAMALFGALVYAIFVFPAMLVTLMPPTKGHGPHWMERVAVLYRRILPQFIRYRLAMTVASLVLLAVVSIRFFGMGAEFVPRVFEGDAVVTIRRAPGISLVEARKLDLAVESVLHEFPEVRSTLGMTGRAEVAIDVVGTDNTDILVRLAPPETWTSAATFDGLSERFKHEIENRVAGTFVSVSQPIEDRTNEIISGSRADVSIQVFGDDLDELTRLAQGIREITEDIQGTGDIRVERLKGQPVISARADRQKLATYGVRLADAFRVIAATREGVNVGDIYEGARRFDLRVLQPPRSATPDALGSLRVETINGNSVALGDILEIEEMDGPSAVRRINRRRVVRVDVNLRGRDLLSWVTEAQSAVQSELDLPAGYEMQWGGQFENLSRAQERLQIVVPAAVFIVFGMLYLTFRRLSYAIAVFVTVPLSLAGGMLGLVLRDMPFSLSAAVGFIALGGIAVLNGVVMGQEVLERRSQGHSPEDAVISGCVAVVKAILTTTAVAALGFLPMALSHGAGAEVQRPLATAVAVGIALGSMIALLVLPGIFMWMIGSKSERVAAPDTRDAEDSRG